MQQSFSNTACHCELAAKHPFFETLQSCVSTKVTLSHRFKSSPAISGNLAVFCAAGYLMNAGHFSRNLVSSGDLNRGRRTESRVLFGYFLHNAKSDKPFSLQRTSRFCKPRISTPKQQLRTNPIKSFAALSPPTWSPCSRPFAILPVSAVSDAQKLATGNFLHVRAATFSYFL